MKDFPLMLTKATWNIWCNQSRDTKFAILPGCNQTIPFPYRVFIIFYDNNDNFCLVGSTSPLSNLFLHPALHIFPIDINELCARYGSMYDFLASSGNI